MKLHNEGAEIFVPDGSESIDALQRTTHLAIGAHQDDLEIFAYHGIAATYRKTDSWFTGVTCTNGAGSPRAGAYAGMTDREMREVRLHEQRQAAVLGEYGALVQLDYPSSTIKNPQSRLLETDLAVILERAQPEVLYTHNPADKHDTHIAVVLACIRAVRSLPKIARPKRVLGCEVWRDLDWLTDDDKQLLDVSPREHLAQALVAVFDSQIAGGKRYDLASVGRRRANATFFESHSVDTLDQATFALDLMPLIEAEVFDPVGFIAQKIDTFREDVTGRLNRLLGAV